MGQKITEFPQVDYWVKLTREADKAGATLPHRDSADKKELSQYGDMERARFRSSYSVLLPASMLKNHIDPDETTAEEQKQSEQYDSEDDGDEVAADDAPGASDGDKADDEAEEEDGEDGDAESA